MGAVDIGKEFLKELSNDNEMKQEPVKLIEPKFNCTTDNHDGEKLKYALDKSENKLIIHEQQHEKTKTDINNYTRSIFMLHHLQNDFKQIMIKLSNVEQQNFSSYKLHSVIEFLKSFLY